MSQTYKFSTFQELLDRVPAARIRACLNELGVCLGNAKATAILHWEVARTLAEKDGRTFPEMPERLVEIPSEFEWVDDGKGEVTAHLEAPNSEGFLSVTSKVEEQI